MKAVRALALLLLALTFTTGSAQAQNFWSRMWSAPQARPTPCVLDKCVGGAAGPAASTNGPLPSATPSGFDFYVLALSWSPGFCDAGGARKAPDQCQTGAGLGFVVHGLWPQFDQGYPSDCAGGSRPISRAALALTQGVYPDEGLARYEWRKHGACTGLDPQAYFASVRRARDAIVIPDALKAPREEQNVAPLDIARAFASANPGLRPQAMAVGCARGELQDVRLCLSKDLRQFVNCPQVARRACHASSIRIAPLR